MMTTLTLYRLRRVGRRFNIITFAMGFTLVFATVVSAEHRPQILTTGDAHPAMVEKVQSVKWAKSLYDVMKKRVDVYADKVQQDPQWATARLAMNWDTHHIQAVTKGSRTVGGKGRAPIPTPRFAGARDWKTDYSRQPLDERMPYNDQDGKIFLINNKTKQAQWVDPAITGHCIERMNTDLMGLAQDAAFVYWITGEKKYAQLAASILWPYMHGLSYVQPPLITDGNKGSVRIIGTTSYEVIHDGILEQIALTYDFLRAYIAESPEIDADIIEQGIKVIIDRVAAGGGAEGNWNMHQASKIAYGGLALGPNSAYADGKGRAYYVDIVLNAQLKQQKGITHVIRENLDADTGLWPEAAGYAFDSVANIIELSSLVSSDPAGTQVMQDPLLIKALLAMRRVAHPNGYSNAVGDTSYTRVDARALELMIAWAVTQGDTQTAATLSAALQEEVASGAYQRDHPKDNLVALTRHVSELPQADAQALKLKPTYFAQPLNIVMQRNAPASGDTRYALSAAMFGTKGGHMHTNGMAIELYGAGHVLGVDPGRGSSYWQPDHNQYYRALPSHNTVLINGGEASYPSNHKTDKSRVLGLTIDHVEPAFGQDAHDPGFGYLSASFRYPKPAATQQRVLALVRIDDTTAFYFDVFRSRLNAGSKNEYHDWLYHAMAEQVDLTRSEGQAVELTATSLLSHAHGNAKGYDYFENESSAVLEDTFRARMPITLRDDPVGMDLWMVAEQGRQVFLVDAPANRGARHVYPASVWDRPRPALVVRQTGEAWKRPFVAVYEPYRQEEGGQITSVESTGESAWRVRGAGWAVDLTLDGATLTHAIQRD